VGPGYLDNRLDSRCTNKLSHKDKTISHIREIGEVFGFGEVFEILAPFEKGVVFEVLLDAEMVEVVWVRQGLNELLLCVSNTRSCDSVKHRLCG
jgi:hypothetical protein